MSMSRLDPSASLRTGAGGPEEHERLRSGKNYCCGGGTG